MPQRPRQHQLETESRTALRLLIPSRWVYRDLDQDYGVDSEVEIFNESGSATGIKFLVQIKATDNPDLRTALRLWFPRSKGEYYASLDLPVLITRYHAPSKRLFVRWFHSLDPYYGTRTRAGISFRLMEHDAWDDTMPDRIVKEVEAFREIRSPRLREPLRFSLSFKEDHIHGIPAYQLRLKLQEALRMLRHIIALDSDATAGIVSPHAISVSNEKVEVKLGGCHGFTLHTRHGYPREHAESSFHHDIMVCIGLALDSRGHSIEGADLITPFLIESRLARKLEIAFPLARCLARANQMHRALEVAEHFFEDDSTVDAAQAFMMPFLVHQAMLPNSERDFGFRVLRRIAADVERRGDGLRAAALNYTCANVLRSMSRGREAIHHYREAARIDNAYLDRPYYWRELAGVLFLSRRYLLAANFYRRSLELEDHRLTRYLYADALMFSGHYREAQETFEQQLQDPVPPDEAEWALKRFAMSWLREQIGIDKQQRRQPTFPENFQPRNLMDAEIEHVCGEALNADALSALAWFNLGGVRNRAGDNEGAANCFLLAALIVPWDLEAWDNTVCLAIQNRDVSLFGHALCAAYRINGEGFLRQLADRVPKGREEFVGMLAQVANMLPSQDGDFTVRTHDANGGWREVIVSPDGKLRADRGASEVREPRKHPD